jgi:hypothetical protein
MTSLLYYTVAVSVIHTPTCICNTQSCGNAYPCIYIGDHYWINVMPLFTACVFQSLTKGSPSTTVHIKSKAPSNTGDSPCDQQGFLIQWIGHEIHQRCNVFMQTQIVWNYTGGRGGHHGDQTRSTPHEFEEPRRQMHFRLHFNMDKWRHITLNISTL